jgi:hypothetical protein
MKPREFWMDTDLLDRAIKSCDLGDGYMAKVRMYPHKDMVSQLTKVREVIEGEQGDIAETFPKYLEVRQRLTRTQKALAVAKEALTRFRLRKR